MSTDGIKGIVDTIVAANDFRVAGCLYKAVNEYGQFTAAAERGAAGIAYSQPNSGQHLMIVRQGVAKAYIGAAISSKGLQLRVAASGYLAICLSGDLGIGKLLQPCNSGDLVDVFVDFSRGSVPAP